MNELHKIIEKRRDTRHFTEVDVPQEVLEKALKAGYHAPSVGLTNATKFYVIKSKSIQQEIKNIFDQSHQKAASKTDNEFLKQKYLSLKLEAIEEAPIGLIITYDKSVLNSFTIGTIGSNEAIKFSAVCAAQNIWLSLTEQGYSMGWVSILNYQVFKKLLNLPENIEPIGYFCIGKPTTNYDNQPMLQQLGWNEKEEFNYNEITQINSLEQINKYSLRKEQIETILSDNDIWKIIDSKTKPIHSLGKLELIAFQLAKKFQTRHIELKKPAIVVFAADHGIANHGVSKYSSEATRFMVENFLNGGAAINVFCNQNNIDLKIVDAGVNYDFPHHEKLINHKVAKGTQSFLHAPAMSKNELLQCREYSYSLIDQIAETGTNIIGFGEMGIGNTSSASLLLSCLLNFPLEQTVGKGTGVENSKLKYKLELLQEAKSKYVLTNFETALINFGGFEIAQMVFAFERAYQQRMVLLVDGFIASVAFLYVYLKEPRIIENAIFCHQSEEKGHQLILDYLNVKPILSFNMCLGEGTGVAVAYPIIQSAVNFYNQMASFEDIGLIQQD